MRLFMKTIYNKSFASNPYLYLVAKRSVASTQAKPEVLSKHMKIRKAFDSKLNADERPLILLYSWLRAKSSHLNKYSDFYLTKGFDVLQITTTPSSIVAPKKARKSMEELLNYINSEHDHKPLFVHGFSVGGYLFGETLKHMKDKPKLYESVSSRIKGQCFDSPVDVSNIAKGLAHVLAPNNPNKKAFLKSAFSLYLQLTKNITGSYYNASQDQILNNYFGIPTLFFYSKSDPICSFELINSIISDHERKNIPVLGKWWTSSPHVLHMKQDPVEYIGSLNNFLESVDLLPKGHLEKEDMISKTEKIKETSYGI
ncbi:DgyrCDS2469 [Dimorphilus gyrociliatus]|uniref:DgyrCDS2469 n=1 Tax=Dimorphilus gyrociliatus TaxID=2664684 RepID=A0A7I8VAS3_9ANNE|nr:DgyrCDS2469 [Dimorphilus gyrociliatus]